MSNRARIFRGNKRSACECFHCVGHSKQDRMRIIEKIVDTEIKEFKKWETDKANRERERNIFINQVNKFPAIKNG